MRQWSVTTVGGPLVQSDERSLITNILSSFGRGVQSDDHDDVVCECLSVDLFKSFGSEQRVDPKIEPCGQPCRILKVRSFPSNWFLLLHR